MADEELVVLRGPSTQRISVTKLVGTFFDSGHRNSELVVCATLRPVILLQDRPQGVLDDVLALATVRVDSLPKADRERVREQEEPSLFHIPIRPEKYGLNHEVAVDLNALSRLNTSLLLPRTVGTLDANEMRVIGERLVSHLDIDIEPVIAAQVEERLTRLAAPEML